MMSKFFYKVCATLSSLLKTQRQLEDMKVNQGKILAALNRDRRFTDLADYEFKVFSQWGEDGIIQHLVTHLNIANRTFIEFGVEDFSEANCRFLLVNNHWRGFIIDGSERNMDRLRRSDFFWRHQLEYRAQFIDKDNIDSLLSQSGFSRDPGILSVDIDGVDYFVLEALSGWNPAIIIVEYNEAFGYRHAVSVPYDPQFVRSNAHWSNQYYGASLPAFLRLANSRGYGLAGINGKGSNAFFVRRDLLNERVRETTIEACARPQAFRDSRNARGELTFKTGPDRLREAGTLPLLDVSTGATMRVSDLFS
jgi:hypothetical protein